MEILKKERGNSWRKRLLEMKVGQKVAIEYKSKETVRSIIGRDILDSHPERQFPTKKMETTIEGGKVKYLEVRRIK